jgi:hypothetical protein
MSHLGHRLSRGVQTHAQPMHKVTGPLGMGTGIMVLVVSCARIATVSYVSTRKLAAPLRAAVLVRQRFSTVLSCVV